MKEYPNLTKYNYQIIRELGLNREGGRISYLANKIDGGKQVVIKQFRFLSPDSSWRGFKIYEREINILKELNHPRIPEYLDSFETPDGFCMVQKYQEAPTLATFADLSPEIVKKISISVLEILVDLQQRKPPIIHRDLKPENILIDSEYNAYLIDFGLAKIPSQEIAVSSIAAGTPGFMPPEEVFNHSLTPASDLYSLGATLIGLLTNTPSTEISSLMDYNYHFNFEHKLPQINPLFISWLKKMVEPNVQKRFPNAMTALHNLKPINVYRESNQFITKSYSQKSLIMGSLMLAIMALGITIFNSPNSPFSKPIKTQSTATSTTSNGGTNLSLNPAQQWFQNIKPHCNSVEVITTMKNSPPPKTTEGMGYAAACYALAGKIDQAEELIKPLTKKQQKYAAGIVFGIGHPVADAGDDQSAGPIMNLVVKYQPWNYMALYHAGMSAYILGDLETSQQHLESFLEIYQNNDGWRKNAITVLNRIKPFRY